MWTPHTDFANIWRLRTFRQRSNFSLQYLQEIFAFLESSKVDVFFGGLEEADCSRLSGGLFPKFGVPIP